MEKKENELVKGREIEIEEEWEGEMEAEEFSW